MTVSSPPTGIRLILLDMDGVLVDTSPCHARAYAELWAQLGIHGPPYTRIAGRRTAEVVAEWTAQRSPSPEQLASWVATKQESARRHLESIVPFPDVIPALQQLSSADLPLAVGSSASSVSALQALASIRQSIHFQCVITGDDVTHGKPAPDIFGLAMDRCGTGPQDTLIIEDSSPGLAAAAASGAWHASVRTRFGSDSAQFVGAFGDLQQVADWLTGARV